jgi:protein-tyrosine phosphatase
VTRSLRSPNIDASLVAPHLFVGARPPPGRYHWINVIVLCAKEFQPPSYAYPGQTVLRVPINDDFLRPLSESDTALVISNARTVARYLESGARVLVTCRMGINRSALIAAMAMQIAYDMSAAEAVDQIRATRSPWALNNPRFERMVQRFEKLR